MEQRHSDAIHIHELGIRHRSVTGPAQLSTTLTKITFLAVQTLISYLKKKS